ncbi:MAG: hypothetical protein JRH20_22215 [Deltaproteobacteria bacterium]|nr:hypothetical protein [Deltaproteobacteria bacterium]
MMAGAILLPSVSFAAGYQGKYVTLRTPKSINKYKPRHKVNMPAHNAAFHTEAQNYKRANSVEVQLPNGQKLMAPTHLFGKTVVVPYSDTATAKDAKGIKRHGETALNQVVGSGEVLFAVKNHRNGHPTLQMAQGVNKEDIKIQDSHAQFVVGVKRRVNGRNVRGAMSFNNPQAYPNGEAGPGRFGDATYNSIVFRPKYPAYLLGRKSDGRAARRDNSRYLVRAFNNNIRTMLLGFNAVTKFPGDYNGGDPLSSFNPKRVKEATRHMINAIAGTGQDKAKAEAYFANQDNQVYCAELGYVSASAAVHVPLNRAGVVEGLGISEQTWTAFKTAVKSLTSRLRWLLRPSSPCGNMLQKTCSKLSRRRWRSSP